MFTHEADQAIAVCAEAMGADMEAALNRAFEGYDRWVQNLKDENYALKAELERTRKRVLWLIGESELL